MNTKNITIKITFHAILFVVFSISAHGTIIFSTYESASIGGVSFGKDDLVEYDVSTDTAAILFDADLFGHGNKKIIDAFYMTDSGTIILSSKRGHMSSKKEYAMFGGLNFGGEDLIEYDPATDTASIFFDGDLFTEKENIDAVHVLDNGNVIISTTSSATLGGLSFSDGDLVEYDFGTGTTSLYFSESEFSSNEDIDAVHVLDSGNILLSTKDSAQLGGVSFEDGDVIEYNISTGTVSLYFNEDRFGSNEDIDALFVSNIPIKVPEPATVSILGIGGIILLRLKRKQLILF